MVPKGLPWISNPTAMGRPDAGLIPVVDWDLPPNVLLKQFWNHEKMDMIFSLLRVVGIVDDPRF